MLSRQRPSSIRGEIEALPLGPLPEEVRGLILAAKAYERALRLRLRSAVQRAIFEKLGSLPEYW